MGLASCGLVLVSDDAKGLHRALGVEPANRSLGLAPETSEESTEESFIMIYNIVYNLYNLYNFNKNISVCVCFF